MISTRLDRFFATCTAPAPGQGITLDELYGLYVCWCALRSRNPASLRHFHAAVQHHDPHPVSRDGVLLFPGLGMTGPAADSYLAEDTAADLAHLPGYWLG